MPRKMNVECYKFPGLKYGTGAVGSYRQRAVGWGFALLILLLVSGRAPSQHLLSPPERPPVPLSDSDQPRAEKIIRSQPAAAAKPASTTIIKPEQTNAVRHISTGNPVTDALVLEAAIKYAVDPCLIISVMGTESSFNARAVSPKGASGLMQLMPETAARFGVANIFDPRENIHGGVRYLRWLLDYFGGDLRLAVAAYNAGEGAVEFYGNQIPPYQETQNYVRLVYARYSAAHASTEKPQASVAITNAEQLARPAPAHNQVIRLANDASAGVASKPSGSQ